MVLQYQQHLAKCFIQKDTKFTEGLKEIIWFLPVFFWFEITHTNTKRTRQDQLIDTHIFKYILTAPTVCTPQLPLLHWMNNLMTQKFTNSKKSEVRNVSGFQKLFKCTIHISYIHIFRTFLALYTHFFISNQVAKGTMLKMV